MSEKNDDSQWSPTPEQLAAYADGELDRWQGAPLRGQIAEWLLENPKAAAEVDAQRRLLQLWKTSAAPDPGEAAWASLWGRIHSPSNGKGPRTGWLRRRLGWSAAVLLLAAAAVVLAVNLMSTGDGLPENREVVEPLPVARADEVEILQIAGSDTGTVIVGRLPAEGALETAVSHEVEILRVNGADTEAIVVGELPVQGPMVLAKAGDVTMMQIDPALDNMKPEARVDGPDAPMIWASLGTDAPK
jgi:hypothetical protein